MKTLYLECAMGAAGDMLTAALYELLSEKEQQHFLQTMQTLIPGVTLHADPAEKSGVHGTHMRVVVNGEEELSVDADGHEHEHDHKHHHDHDHEHHHDHDHEHDHDHDHEHHHDHDHEHHHDHDHGHHHDHEHEHHHDHDHHHHHTSMADITQMVSAMPLPDAVRRDILAVYHLIADAESHVHGTSVDQIHFHEVGTLDAVADVTAVCLLMHMLQPESVMASPVHVGSGSVHCMHGILPVPAPATALLLSGIPSYSADIRGELCTPTGAALLRYFVSSFGPMPALRTESIGYGMGQKDFPRANMLRAFLGESAQTPAMEKITKLECNIDDMTGEQLGFAQEMLLAQGARDVFLTPIYMKKNRPAHMLSVICLPQQADALAEAIMRHTSTLGIRRLDMDRYVLSRQVETLPTSLGSVRRKTAEGLGVSKSKLEYDDLSRIARENRMSLREVLQALEKELSPQA